MAIEHDPVAKTLVEFLPEEIAQLAHVALVAWQVCLRHLTGLAQANGKDDVLCAGAASRFMSSPVDERFKPHARTHVERPNALGSIHFVTSDGEEIDAKLVHQGRNFAHRLRRISVHQDTMCMRHTANICN